MTKEKTAVDLLYDSIKDKLQGDDFESLVFSYSIAKQKFEQQIVDVFPHLLSGIMFEEFAIIEGEQYFQNKFEQ